MKITNYKVVYTDQVPTMIGHGWQPCGSPFVIGTDSFQAVVTFEVTQESNKTSGTI